MSVTLIIVVHLGHDLYFVMAKAVSFGTVYLVYGLSTCGLLQYFLASGTVCPSESTFAIMSKTHSISNCITDMILAGIAVFATMRTQVTVYAKLTATLLLCFGTVGGIASILRTTQIFNLRPETGDSTNAIKGLIWSLIELTVGVTATSLATLRPLFRCMKDRVSTNGSGILSTNDTWGGVGNFVPTALRGSNRQSVPVPDWRDGSTATNLEKGTHLTTTLTSSDEGKDEAGDFNHPLQTHNLVMMGEPSRSTLTSRLP